MRAASDSTVFNALASDTRRALLDALREGESSVGDLVARLDVSQPAVSQQLAVLKAAGLVQERAQGRFRVYRLQALPLVEVAAWVERYRRYWESRLDALHDVLDDMDEGRPADSVSDDEKSNPEGAARRPRRDQGAARRPHDQGAKRPRRKT